MKSFEDKRRCPHCGEMISRQPYLMARDASANVLTWSVVAWIVIVAFLIAIVSS